MLSSALELLFWGAYKEFLGSSFGRVQITEGINVNVVGNKSKYLEDQVAILLCCLLHVW